MLSTQVHSCEYQVHLRKWGCVDSTQLDDRVYIRGVGRVRGVGGIYGLSNDGAYDKVYMLIRRSICMAGVVGEVATPSQVCTTDIRPSEKRSTNRRQYLNPQAGRTREPQGSMRTIARRYSPMICL